MQWTIVIVPEQLIALLIAALCLMAAVPLIAACSIWRRARHRCCVCGAAHAYAVRYPGCNGDGPDDLDEAPGAQKG